jgi:hypothetical protein
MATAPRPAAQLSEAFQFNPKWWWDPVPPWLLEQLTAPVIREIGVIHLEAQLAALEIQSKALEKALAVLRKAK